MTTPQGPLNPRRLLPSGGVPTQKLLAPASGSLARGSQTGGRLLAQGQDALVRGGFVASRYAPNLMAKLVSAVVAATGGYAAWRNWRGNNGFTQSRLNRLQQADQVEQLNLVTGSYNQDAPVLSDLANWVKRRQLDVVQTKDRIKTQLGGLGQYAVDTWMPLAAIAGAMGVGFKHELKAMVRTIGRYVPNTNWPRIAARLSMGTFTGLGHVLGAGWWSIKKLFTNGMVTKAFKKAPLPSAILAGLGVLTAGKFAAVYSNQNPQVQLTQDLNKVQ
jgi:hypothetical protein